jgi:hypothetical protein
VKARIPRARWMDGWMDEWVDDIYEDRKQFLIGIPVP